MEHNNRFIEVYNQKHPDVGMLPGGINMRVFVDRFTGVQYLWHRDYNSGGLTVLLDQDGKPLLYQPPNTNR